MLVTPLLLTILLAVLILEGAALVAAPQHRRRLMMLPSRVGVHVAPPSICPPRSGASAPPSHHPAEPPRHPTAPPMRAPGVDHHSAAPAQHAPPSQLLPRVAHLHAPFAGAVRGSEPDARKYHRAVEAFKATLPVQRGDRFFRPVQRQDDAAAVVSAPM